MESHHKLLDSPPEYNEIIGEDRNTFIKKVYTILYLQIMVTIGICSLFVYNDSIKEFMQNSNGGQALLTTSLIFQFVLMIVLVCTNIHRKYPWNYIVLCFFTIFLSITLGTVSSYYDTNALLMASGSTALITIGLTLFAFQTKYDFSGYGPYLLCFLLVLVFMGFMAIFIKNKIYNIIYSSIGALLFSFFIVYDTQLIIGGKHKYSYDINDHVFAALSLYLDIVNLFVYLLDLIR